MRASVGRRLLMVFLVAAGLSVVGAAPASAHTVSHSSTASHVMRPADWWV